VPRELRKRHRAWGPTGKRIHIIESTPLNSPSISISVLANLSSEQQHPLQIILNEGTNTQFNFFTFILFLIHKKHLVEGDFFIVDNARIHNSNNTFLPLQDILDAAGVRMIFLPTFSPELNPVELVHAQVKAFIRNHPSTSAPLWYQIAHSVKQVTFQNVLNYYKKCLK